MSRCTEPLLPVEPGRSGISFARGVRAGPWVFATGVLATDFRTGLDPGIIDAEVPFAGPPRFRREADRVFARVAEVLAAGGTAFERSVRSDQFYPTPLAVADFQAARRAALGAHIPPSTSILQAGLVLPEAAIEVEWLAASPDDRIETFHPPALETPAGAGFCPVVRCRDLVFVAGFLPAHGPGDLHGIPPEARMPAGHLWKGTPIKLEAEYVFARKLAPALEAAGSSFDRVAKAWVFLSHIEDLPAFDEVWRKWFPKDPPARIVVPASRPGFAIADARIEVNLVAVSDRAPRPRRVVVRGDPEGGGVATAVRAGDLLLLSGLIAPGLGNDPRRPFFGSRVEREMECLLARAARICDAAGTSLANVARAQQFHADLRDLHAATRVWQRLCPGLPLPLSAIAAGGPLPAPGAAVLLDLWIHAPG
jgi:enamine deaminase RidA (YjgF/YER057c/UK114 family)